MQERDNQLKVQLQIRDEYMDAELKMRDQNLEEAQSREMRSGRVDGN